MINLISKLIEKIKLLSKHILKQLHLQKDSTKI